MGNIPFSTSIFGKRLSAATRSRQKMTIGSVGESHGLYTYLGPAITYAMQRYYPADVIWDWRDYATGGQTFAVGGTSIDSAGAGNEGLTVQVATFVPARVPDIMFVAAGWNDCAAPAKTAESIRDAIATEINNLFLLGVQHIILIGVTPSSGTGAITNKRAALNILLDKLARETPFVHFVNVFPAIGNKNNSAAPYSYALTGDVIGSMSADGTHWSNYAGRLVAAQIADILRLIAPPLPPFRLPSQGNYDPVAVPYGNLMGNVGNMIGTQGVNFGSIDGSVAGEGTSSRLSLTKTTSTGATVTPSIEVAADGTRKQVLTLGGTAGPGTLDVRVTVSIPSANGGDASRKLMIDGMVELVGTTGINGVFWDLNGLGNPNRSPVTGTSGKSSASPDARTETLRVRTTYPLVVPSGTVSSFFLYIQPVNDTSIPLAGAIKLSNFGAHLV